MENYALCPTFKAWTKLIDSRIKRKTLTFEDIFIVMFLKNYNQTYFIRFYIF